MMKNRMLLMLIPLVFGCGPLACQSTNAAPASDGGTGDHAHDHGADLEALNEEACEHLGAGPFVSITAGPVAIGAPEVVADHQVYRVALPAGEAGFVWFAAAHPGELVVFSDASVPLEVQDDRGAAVTIEETVWSVAQCATVKARHIVPLSTVGVYYLRLGPDTTGAVPALVLELSAEDEHG